MFSIPSDCSFGTATSSYHHDSTHGLHHPSDAALTSITLALTTVFDDTSHGLLRHSHSPSFPLTSSCSARFYFHSCPNQPFHLCPNFCSSPFSVCISFVRLASFLPLMSLALKFLLSFGDSNLPIATFLWITVTTLTRTYSFLNSTAKPPVILPPLSPTLVLTSISGIASVTFLNWKRNFVVGSDAEPAIHDRIVSIIESHWDNFYSTGVMKPVLHFEFTIGTGGLPPVCCRKPRYGPHESKIIMT